jgi:hypothetical protein
MYNVFFWYKKENMKRRSFKRKCFKFDYDLPQPFDSLYKQTSRPGVCQINSVNLNLTASINYKVQSLEYIGPYLYALSVVTCGRF